MPTLRIQLLARAERWTPLHSLGRALMRLFVLSLATALLIPTIVFAQQHRTVDAGRATAPGQPIPLLTQESLLPPPSVPVQEWLNGPDRQDFAWKVQISQDLTLQQRHLIQVRAIVKESDLPGGVPRPELHIVTKVADEHGNWLDGQSYTHFVQPAKFSRNDSVHPFANLYLRPGDYIIAMIAYDPVNHSGNVWRTKLTVSPASGPLADLGRDFPVVEFLPPAAAALGLTSADCQGQRHLVHFLVVDSHDDVLLRRSGALNRRLRIRACVVTRPDVVPKAGAREAGRYAQEKDPADLSSENAPAARPRSFQASSAQQPRLARFAPHRRICLDQFIWGLAYLT